MTATVYCQCRKIIARCEAMGGCEFDGWVHDFTRDHFCGDGEMVAAPAGPVPSAAPSGWVVLSSDDPLLSRDEAVEVAAKGNLRRSLKGEPQRYVVAAVKVESAALESRPRLRNAAGNGA